MALFDVQHHRDAYGGDGAVFTVAPLPGDDPACDSGAVRRDRGAGQTTTAACAWEVAEVDGVIRRLAARGRPFSANDVRPLLDAAIRPSLLGARLLAAGDAAGLSTAEAARLGGLAVPLRSAGAGS